MKKLFISIISIFCCLSAFSYDFAYTFGENEWNMHTLYFDWVVPGETCQTAAATDIELVYGPNQYNPSQYEWQIVSPGKQSWEIKGPNSLSWGAVQIPSTVNYDGKTVTVVGIGDFSFLNGELTGNLGIPETIEYIGKGAFYGWNQSCERLDLPNVKKIGDFAFYNCPGLNNLSIPSCIEVGDYAFYNAGSLKSLTLGEGLTRIGNYAFYSCRTLEELTIPDTTEYIGDYAFCYCDWICPLKLGKNIRYIGDYAFHYAMYNATQCGISALDLPGTLEHVGAMAFCFNNTATSNRTSGEITDLYIPRSEPPTVTFTDDGCGPFGKYDKAAHESGAFYSNNTLWMYPYICLHVPAGSLEAYRNAPGWKDFICIIDDIVDMGSSSVEDIENIGYAFMVPGESLDLQKDIFAGDVFKMAGREEDFYWEIQDNLTDDGELIAELGNGSVVTADHFGQALAVLYRNDGNQTFNGSSYDDVEPTIAGCVIIFVCPTITVVYNNDNSENSALLSSRRSKFTDNTTSGESSVEALIDPYISYEHRVVYNSLPKLTIESSPRVNIDSMERGESNEDDIFVKQMDEFDDKQFTDDGRIVPLDPITNNRIIELFLTDEGTLSSVETIKLTDSVSLKVAGRTVSVVGAADTDTVKVFDTAGRTVYNSNVKTFAINGTGVFVVTVANTAFKILVK